MASVAVKNDIPAGNDNTWGWVTALENGASSLSANVSKLGSVMDEVGSVVTTIFGGGESQKKNTNNGGSSLLPLLALGGGLALLLK